MLLVTGASGFVGRTLFGMVDTAGAGGFGTVVPLSEAADLRESEMIERSLAGRVPDAVIHLAALSFVPESIARPLDAYAVNLIGTMNLLDVLQRQGFRGTFLYVSSGDVYGAVPPEEMPITEARAPRPRNPYAASKLAAETYCLQLGLRVPVRMLIVRPFNHIGPGQSDRFVLAGFARQIAEIKQGKRSAVIDAGNVDVTRDFSDVRDVVRAYLKLLESGVTGEIYNVSSGVERNLGEVLRQMQAIAGVNATLRSDATKLRPNEQTRHCGSNRKLCEDTGWAPEVPFEQSLRDLLESWTPAR